VRTSRALQPSSRWGPRLGAARPAQRRPPPLGVLQGAPRPREPLPSHASARRAAPRSTLIFYAVLLTICQQVAEVLGEPLERISVEMVSRAFYHYSRAVQHGEADDLVLCLAAHAKLLGLVKRWRKHHRERQQLEYLIWGDP
jgi:hypothetical protein